MGRPLIILWQGLEQNIKVIFFTHCKKGGWRFPPNIALPPYNKRPLFNKKNKLFDVHIGLHGPVIVYGHGNIEVNNGKAGIARRRIYCVLTRN